jgi:tripartite ATP-independent transporter DctP family solute receptor
MNKRRTLQIIYALVFVGCLYGITNSTSTDAEFTIKVANQGSTLDEDYIGLVAMKRLVEEKSQGRIALKIYPSGQFCGSVPECVGNLQQGVLEIFSTTVGGTGNFLAEAQVLDLPYVFTDDQVAECVLAGPMLSHMRQTALDRGLGIRLIGASNTGGWRNFATVGTPIQGPDDLAGLKIRTTPSAIQQELARQLGANPTPVSWSEVYTALATGVVEGSKNGIQDIINAKLHEHIKHITLDGHSYMAALWWFSENAWEKLPEDIQLILIEGFEEQRTVARAMVRDQENLSYRQFEQAGGTVYRPTIDEKKQFQQASSAMRQWFIENYGAQWVNLLENSVQTCESSFNR